MDKEIREDEQKILRQSYYVCFFQWQSIINPDGLVVRTNRDMQN